MHWVGDRYWRPGPEGNDIQKTNVPNLRMRFRHDCLQVGWTSALFVAVVCGISAGAGGCTPAPGLHDTGEALSVRSLRRARSRKEVSQQAWLRLHLCRTCSLVSSLLCSAHLELVCLYGLRPVSWHLQTSQHGSAVQICPRSLQLPAGTCCPFRCAPVCHLQRSPALPQACACACLCVRRLNDGDLAVSRATVTAHVMQDELSLVRQGAEAQQARLTQSERVES